jgi:predicted chitinase
MSVIPPNNNTTLIIDDFINYATAHLSTVTGIVNTISLYPPLGTPAPGVLPWTGYQVAPATLGGGVLEVAEEVLAAVQIQQELIQADIATANEILVTEGIESSVDNTIVVDYIANQQELIYNPVVITEAVVSTNEQKVSSILVKSNQPPEETPTPGPKLPPSKNLDLIEKALIKIGITNTKIIRAVKANAMKESGGQPIEENLNYGSTSNERIKSIFGARAKKYTDAQLDTIKKDKASMGELMYGPDSGQVGKWLGNTTAGDGYKYRGRGFIQITGKGNYTAASLALYKDTKLVTNPGYALDAVGAADTCAWFINRSLASFTKKMGIPKDTTSQEDANLLVTSIIAGSPIKRSGTGYLTTLVVKVDKYASQIA